MVPSLKKKRISKNIYIDLIKVLFIHLRIKMKKDILTLINKNSLFQLEIRNIKKLIQYYYGKSKKN